MLNRLLNKQVGKFLSVDLQQHPDVQLFLAAINDSYNSFERDKQLLNHAFSITETEYKELYESLNKEYESKHISIEKLKAAVKLIEREDDTHISLESDNLVVIVDYLNSEVLRRKITENNLKTTLKLLTTLLSNLNSGVLVEDEQNNILFKNKFISQMFEINYSEDEMKGLDRLDLIAHFQKFFLSKYNFQERIQEILLKKEPVFNELLFLSDSRVIERDYIPIFINEEYKGHFWDYRDITEREKANIKLKESLKELSDYKYAIDSSLIVAVTNNEGVINYVNDVFCKISKYDYSELIGKSYRILNAGNEEDVFFDEIYRTIKRGKLWRGEIKNKAKDGSIYWVNSTFIPFKHISGDIYQFLTINYDITDQKDFETKLIDANKLQDAILNGTDYSIIYTDLSGVIKKFNKGAEQLLGYSAAEVENVYSPSLFHSKSELIEKAKELSVELAIQISPGFDTFTAKAKNNQIETNECTYIKKNGEKLIVLLSVSSLLNSRNEIIGFLGIARDISGKKKIQIALEHSELSYRNLVEKSTDIIYKINMEGYFIYVNEVAQRITGFSQEELINRHFSNLVKKEYQKLAIKFYKKQIRERKTTTYLEFPILTKSGEEKWIGQSVQLTQINLNSFDLTALAIDVTDRKNYERSIFLQKEKYLSIINNMNLGLLEVGLDESIQSSNPIFQNMSGYTEQELIGKNASNLFLSKEGKELIGNKTRLRREGVSDSYETPIIKKNGELNWWLISGAPNFNESNELIGSIGIHLDITTQKNLEFALESSKIKAEESSKAKEVFLANMSHEIRTPLSAIIGMIRELSKEKMTPNQKKYAENSSIASQHLLSVVNNIMDISKIEAGELQLDLHHFNLSKIISDVYTILENKFIEKNIYCKINHPKNKNVIFIGDSSRFRQVFLNIIGNALKFTQFGGVTINYDVLDLRTGFQSLFMSISDTGVGIDPSYLKSIFDKFSQEDNSTARKYGGSGLGLSITRELILMMNGSIEIETQKNQGTTIKMTFEVEIGDTNKIIEDVQILQTIRNDKQRLSVLLVEDNEFNRLVAGNTLNSAGIEFTEACNGQEAIDILSKGIVFDVILMDLQMPIIDGFQCTSFIRNELKILTPIIALTANAFKSELDQCIRYGMNDFISKPFDELKLIDSIYKLTNIQFEKNIKSTPFEFVQKLYDLTELKKVSGGDKDFESSLITSFFEQANDSVIKIKMAYSSNDLVEVHKIIHKVKPVYDFFGVVSIKESILFIEKNSKELNDSDELKGQLQIFIDTTIAVINQLEANKKELE